MSIRLLPTALLAVLLTACGVEPAPPAPSGDTAGGAARPPRAALLEYLERRLERADRKLPPPLSLGGGPGEIRLGGGPLDKPWEGTPAEADQGK